MTYVPVPLPLLGDNSHSQDRTSWTLKPSLALSARGLSLPPRAPPVPVPLPHPFSLFFSLFHSRVLTRDDEVLACHLDRPKMCVLTKRSVCVHMHVCGSGSDRAALTQNLFPLALSAGTS